MLEQISELITALSNGNMDVAAKIGQDFLGMLVMFAIGGILIYLAIKKDYEPALLLPIGFGAILTNIPMTNIFTGPDGETGVFGFYTTTPLPDHFPVLIFIAVGAMIDFTPCSRHPSCCFGLLLNSAYLPPCSGTAVLPLPEAGSNRCYRRKTAPPPSTLPIPSSWTKASLAITVAAYSYMSLVPIIQPPVLSF